MGCLSPKLDPSGSQKMPFRKPFGAFGSDKASVAREMSWTLASAEHKQKAKNGDLRGWSSPSGNSAAEREKGRHASGYTPDMAYSVAWGFD